MFIVYVGTNGEVLVADQVDSSYCYSSERPRVLSTEQRCSSALPSSGAGSCIVSEEVPSIGARMRLHSLCLHLQHSSAPHHNTCLLLIASLWSEYEHAAGIYHSCQTQYV